MSKQVVAKPQGIITEPNKVGQFPPGAFSDCANVAIRSFGVAEQVQNFTSISYLSLAGPIVGGVYMVSDGPYTAILYEHTSLGTWRLDLCESKPSGNILKYAATVTSPWNTYITNDARTGIVIARNRVIITGTVRSFVFDIIESPSGTTYLSGPRNCGVYQTILWDRNSTTGAATDPAYLGPNEHFSATSVLRQVQADGYELISPPAIPGDFTNLSTTLPQVASQWSVYSTLTNVGPSSALHKHKLDVYRTRAQSVGYDSVNNKYRPVSSGSSFYLSKSVDRTTSYDVFSDTTLPSTLGEALLTNVSVSGASALPLPPTPAKTAAVFRGHAFYANRWDPATLTLLNPYFWGYMFMPTQSAAVLSQGIGLRYTVSGQAAVSGSPVVTGFPNTTGVIAGQLYNVYRDDTGANVFSGTVLSKTATTITGSGNIPYTGAVHAQIADLISVNGVALQTSDSPQRWTTYLLTSAVAQTLDVASVGLEPVTIENPVGVYPNFVPTGGLTIRMRTFAPITIKATNGSNFSPKLPEIGDLAMDILGKQQKNGIAWSENNEPENCPPSNYAFVGQGEIYKIIATRDCLWIFASDGLFRLSGSGGSVGDGYDWVVDPVDPSLIITNPQCAVVYREYIYAYTNRGVVSISSEGVVRELSDGRINPSWSYAGVAESFGDLAIENKGWKIPSNPNGTSSVWNWMAADYDNDEIWVRNRPLTGRDRIWVYNVKTDTWTIRRPTLYYSVEGYPLMPSLASYNVAQDQLFCVYDAKNTLCLSGAQGNTNVEYEIATIKFQPLYGNGNGAAYTQKHWQDVNLSFHSAQPSAVATCQMRSQTIDAGTRLIPQTSITGNQMEMARVGFTVPRAWPAMANSITVELIITPPEVTPSSYVQPVKLEGMSISYEEFTEQRVKR